MTVIGQNDAMVISLSILSDTYLDVSCIDHMQCRDISPKHLTKVLR